MTELEKNLSEVRKKLLEELWRAESFLEENPRVKEVEKKMVYQTGYGKTEYFHYSVSVPPIIASNGNETPTNT